MVKATVYIWIIECFIATGQGLCTDILQYSTAVLLSVLRALMRAAFASEDWCTTLWYCAIHPPTCSGGVFLHQGHLQQAPGDLGVQDQA